MPFIGRRARNALEQASLRPKAVQRSLLASILQDNAGTVFGKEHDFSSIRNVEDYRACVPIRDYEDFRPYVEQIIAGEKRVLTRESPFMLATTSGTTGGPKLIPITTRFRRDLADTSRAWLSSVYDAYPSAFEGYCFMPVSPAIEGRTEGGLPYGSMTGLTYQTAPWLFRRSYAVPYEVMLLENYDLRYTVLMRFAMSKDITLALTANPSTWLRLAEIGINHSAFIIEGIRTGTLGPDLESVFKISHRDQAILDSLTKHLAPNPSRASYLSSILELHGSLLPMHVWPNLRVLGCWLGGSAGLQARRLRDFFGQDVALRDPGFRASEATMALPFRDESAAGILATQVNFYEFIPENEVDSEIPTVLEAHELRAGENYSILITTRGGLYRYKINDIIRVEGFHNDGPLVSFLRKGRDVVNLTGEKLHVTQVMSALGQAEKQSLLNIDCYCLIPDVNTMRYDLLVEFEGSEPPQVLDEFLGLFDRTLSQLNGEYQSKRTSGRLHAPRLVLMRSGWSEREKRRQLDDGKRDVQYKWPLLQPSWKSDYDNEVRLAHELKA